MKNQSRADFFIGELPVYGDCILAPMDGLSDRPFREIACEMGSAISFTEFINAMEVIHGNPYLHERLAYRETERPLAFQLFDNDVDRLLKASQILMDYQPDIIDINMGCSVKKVSRRGAGAGLLLEPEKIATIISSLTKNLNVPITAKIRLGWDIDHRNFETVARIIQDNGGKMISVHGRTKDQGFRGTVDLHAIATVKRAVEIPVVANGDIKTVQDIQYVKEYTGCDAMMIGRGAIGNPWLFAKRDRGTISNREVYETIRKHLDAMLEFYGDVRGIILFRKHLLKYLEPVSLSKDFRKRLLAEESQPLLLELIQTALNT